MTSVPANSPNNYILKASKQIILAATSIVWLLGTHHLQAVESDKSEIVELGKTENVPISGATSDDVSDILPSFYKEFNAGEQDEQDSEYVDPFSGSVNVRAVDLHIPGPGGFDITLQRTYSSNNVYRSGVSYAELMETTHVGIGWEMHLGRVRRATNNACTNASNSDASTNPVLETADGSQKQFFYNNALSNRSSAVYVTKDYWHAYCISGGTGLRVVSPDGTQYWMTHRVVTKSRSFNATGYAWYVSKIRDRNGNELNVNYTLTIGESVGISKITRSDGQVVNFGYVGNKLDNVRYNGKEIEYDYGVHDELLEVLFPENRLQTYTYYQGGASPYRYLLHRSTNPSGGYTEYTYKNTCRAVVTCGTTISNGASTVFVAEDVVVETKIENDINGNALKWDYDYTQNNGYDYTTVHYAHNHDHPVAVAEGKIVYKHYSGKWTGGSSIPNYPLIGMLASKSTYQVGVGIAEKLLEKEVYTYAPVKISTQNNSRFPLTVLGLYQTDSYLARTTKKTVTRGGKDYVTEYKNFNNGRYPETIVESGELTRTLTLTYKDVSVGSGAQKLAFLVEDESYGASTNQTIDRTYNVKGNLAEINHYGLVTKYTYHSKGDLNTKEDAVGNVVTYTDYHRGVPRKEEYPESITIVRTVSDDGWTKTETNGRGFKTTYTYDSLGRLKTTTPPIGAATSITWTKSGLKDVQTLTRGSFSHATTYDGFGRVICERLADVYKGTVYDGFGRTTATVLPSNTSCSTSQRTKFTYDQLDRLKKTTHPDGRFSEFTYQDDNKVRLRDEAAKIFNFEYRSYGNPNQKSLRAITGPESLSVTIERNVLGQVTEIDRSGVKRIFDYGTAMPLLASETHPETGKTSYKRYDNGKLETKEVPGFHTTSYFYDGLSRLKKIDYPGFTPDVNYTYDKNNNLETLNAGVTEFTYIYDKNDNLTEEWQKIDEVLYKVINSYSPLDHLASIKYHGNLTVTYTPDGLGRPTTALPYVTNVKYHPNGTPKEISYANGRKSTFTLNSRQWIQRATTDGGISDQEITEFDGVGNVKEVKDYRNSANDRSYTYDNRHRLKTAKGPWGTGFVNYTPTDDISTKQMGSVHLNYFYSGGNLSSIHGVPGAALPVNFHYDSYGNVKTKHSAGFGWFYDYDHASNLRRVLDPKPSVLREFNYSGKNMKVTAQTPTEKRRYIYNEAGNLLSDIKVTGDRPTIHNIYLGSTLVAEVERNVTNPNAQINAESDRSIYGYGFGNNDHKHFVKGFFDLSEIRGNIKFCVDGYGINSPSEVSVEINGNALGNLEPGASPTKTCFVVPSSMLLVGRNVIVFTQSNPGNTYGIQFLRLGRDQFMAPVIMLLLEEEEI